MKRLSNVEMDEIISKIRSNTSDYISSHSIKSLVIGVSGGIDSALVCALLSPICDKFNIPLHGRFISIESNKEDERKRAIEIGKLFCTDFKEVDLTDKFKVLSDIDSDEEGDSTDFSRKIRMGNIKARMRMIYLYNLASRTSGMVMGTENITEHYLGFCTLHGDSGTDFEPIIGLWKTEVYQLAEYIALEKSSECRMSALMDCIMCNATDGLGISSTDLDQILPDWRERYTNTREGYEEVDDIFVDHFTNGSYSDSPVIQRYDRTHFKRNNPYIIEREKIINEK